jgi:hypothetical protein
MLSTEALAAFESLREKLLNPPILALPVDLVIYGMIMTPLILNWAVACCTNNRQGLLSLSGIGQGP